MRISPITTNYKPIKPAFRSMSCEYKLPNNKEMGLYTWMFREDVDWKKLVMFEEMNFKEQDKVNIVQFAPSDGSEGYTKILSILRYVSKFAKKCFPIQAYDINEAVVNGANMGYLNLSIRDIKKLLDNDINVNKYFPGALDYYIENQENKVVVPQTFKVAEELTKGIQFNTGDMFEILTSIKDDSNTILMARNSLGYYPKEKVREFIQEAGSVLKRGSLFIVGKLEDSSLFDAIFNQHRFIRVMKNVYRKA